MLIINITMPASHTRYSLRRTHCGSTKRRTMVFANKVCSGILLGGNYYAFRYYTVYSNYIRFDMPLFEIKFKKWRMIGDSLYYHTGSMIRLPAQIKVP